MSQVISGHLRSSQVASGCLREPGLPRIWGVSPGCLSCLGHRAFFQMDLIMRCYDSITICNSASRTLLQCIKNQFFTNVSFMVLNQAAPKRVLSHQMVSSFLQKACKGVTDAQVAQVITNSKTAKLHAEAALMRLLYDWQNEFKVSVDFFFMPRIFLIFITAPRSGVVSLEKMLSSLLDPLDRTPKTIAVRSSCLRRVPWDNIPMDTSPKST